MTHGPLAGARARRAGPGFTYDSDLSRQYRDSHHDHIGSTQRPDSHFLQVTIVWASPRPSLAPATANPPRRDAPGRGTARRFYSEPGTLANGGPQLYQCQCQCRDGDNSTCDAWLSWDDAGRCDCLEVCCAAELRRSTKK